MKPSHIRTPRTMGECHFQTGYKCADTAVVRKWPVFAVAATILVAFVLM